MLGTLKPGPTIAMLEWHLMQVVRMRLQAMLGILKLGHTIPVLERHCASGTGSDVHVYHARNRIQVVKFYDGFEIISSFSLKKLFSYCS